jgi:hypothetical protein
VSARADRGLREFEDLHGLGEQRQPAVAAFDQPLVSQRDSESTWPAEPACQLDLLTCEPVGLVRVAERACASAASERQ